MKFRQITKRARDGNTKTPEGAEIEEIKAWREIFPSAWRRIRIPFAKLPLVKRSILYRKANLCLFDLERNMMFPS